MNNILKFITLLSFFGTFLLAGDSLKAMKVLGNVSDIGPTSRAWLSASYEDIVLYPQYTIKVDENISSEYRSAKKIRVKTITDSKNISFLIKWADSTRNQREGYSSTMQGDGFALQFPTSYKDAKKLPYIDMGSSERSVVVYLKKASVDEFDEKIDEHNQSVIDEAFEQYKDEIKAKAPSSYQRVFISEGSESIKEMKDDDIKMQMLYKNGYWRATLSMSLKSSYLDLDAGAFPVSFVLWDGSKWDINDMKLLSSWIGVRVVGKNGSDKFINTLNENAKGDVINGEKIALEHCAVCHRYGDTNLAPDFMSPNLSSIGGYSTKAYLVESLIDPSAVVVADHDSNKNKNFTWYFLDNKGKKLSTMPSYDWLDQKSIDDLVAFLLSL